MADKASWYEKHILPWAIDCACGMPAVERERAKMVPLAYGDVLEIGIGTGRNLQYYDATKVKSLRGIDPSLEWHPLAQKRLANISFPVELIPLSAERIPLEDASIDSVVCTYSLCTIPDAEAALAEFRRVLKPDGKLFFCEHGKSADSKVHAWQKRIEPVWKPLAGGCHLTRDVRSMLGNARFSIEQFEHRYLKGPKPITCHYAGIAAK